MALPGVMTILKDRFYTLSRQDLPRGPRVVAIATRNTADGTADTQGNLVKSYDPYIPRSEEDVILAFGLGSAAHRAYLELVAGGAARPAIVALPAGTADADLIDEIDEAFDAAETALPDIIVPWGRGWHPGDSDAATPTSGEPVGFAADAPGLAEAVADKCEEITNRSHPVFAVMGVRPFGWDSSTAATPTPTTELMIASELATHVALAGLPDHNNNMGDNGAYLSVVFTEMRPVGYPAGFGYSNGAAMYAGYLTQLVPWSAPTGKQIFNVAGIRYNPTRTQQEALISKGLVPVALDFSRIPTWVDGRTFGRDTSDYVRLSTLRIVYDAILGVRQVSQQFIGEAASLHNRNALETAIDSMLRGMKQVGALTDADKTVTYLPRENKAIIDLVLRPVFELRNIEISISVQL